MASVRIVSKTDSAQVFRIHRPNKLGTSHVTSIFLMARGEIILTTEELTHDIQDAVKAGKAKMFPIVEPTAVPVVITAPTMEAPVETAAPEKKGKKN